ncbi:Alpha/Beta hydrolase protein [Aspergillus cavernicola]|uniref:Pheromone-processing carboxypeptidase KEX1 n=1 Tax=Aspergillus cavernicola TaxID=176166 RepID=A0ABR4J059_9EURO
MRSVLRLLWAGSSLLSLSPAYATPDVSQFKKVDSLPDGPALPPTEDPAYDDNLMIWFNGGPGCSSLIGLTTGSGPISFEGNSTRLVANPYAWSKFGHVLYMDQPVGTGYSTASEPYPAIDNDRVTTQFYDWLQSFFAHFPHLQSKQVHLMGESWAGIYVPHFASAIVDNQDSFPIKLRSITLGDAPVGNPAAMSTVTIGKFLESQQSILQIPNDILAVFKEADETCGFDDILEQATQFPPGGSISIPGNPEILNYKSRRRSRDLGDMFTGSCNTQPTTAEEVRSSITQSSCSGPCATFSTAMDYLTTAAGRQCDFSIYDVSQDCSTIDSLSLLASYFSRADVQIPLNVLPFSSVTASNSASQPTPSPFSACNSTVLSTVLGSQSPRAPIYSLLPTLVTSHNISLHIFFGEYDMLLNHYGAELVLQNMTWHGTQGFSHPINRPFYPDNAAPSVSRYPHSSSNNRKRNSPTASGAGRFASERGVTYHLFWGAGHNVMASRPREMFAYVRDVVVAG